MNVDSRRRSRAAAASQADAALDLGIPLRIDFVAGLFGQGSEQEISQMRPIFWRKGDRPY